MGIGSLFSLANLAANQMVVIDKMGNVIVANVGDKVPNGSIILEKGNFQLNPGEQGISAKFVESEENTLDITNDVEDIIAGIEQGIDPTALGEEFATAAGGTASSSLTNSATLNLSDEETIAQTSFDTSATFTSYYSETQSLALVDYLNNAILATSIPAASATIILDDITDDNLINSDESGSTVTVTGSVSGDVQSGDTVTLTFEDESGNQTTITGEVSSDATGNLVFSIDVPGSVLASDRDTMIVASVSGMTSSGLSYADSTTKAYTTDLSADTDTTISITRTSNSDADSVINQNEMTDVSFTVDGVDSDAETVLVTFSDGDAATDDITVEATYDVDSGTWVIDGVNLSDLTSGEITTTVTVTDVNDNQSKVDVILDLDKSADEDGASFTVQAIAGNDDVVNADEVTDVAVKLSGVDTDAVSVKVTFSDGTNSVSVNATQDSNGDWVVADVDLSSLNDGNISVTAVVTDDAGNTATASDSLVKDTVAIGAGEGVNGEDQGPTVTIVDDADQDGYVNGTEDSDGKISAEIVIDADELANGGSVTVVIENGDNTTEIELSLDDNGDLVDGDGNSYDYDDTTGTITLPIEVAEGDEVTVTATQTDAAGNESVSGSDNATLDTTAIGAGLGSNGENVGPTVTIVDDLNQDGYINGTEDSDGQVSAEIVIDADELANGGSVTVVIENGDNTTEIELSLDDNGDLVDGDGNSYDYDDTTGTITLPIDVAESDEVTVTATQTDAAGNTSAPGTDSAILDTTAAVAPGVTITEDADNDGYISADELSGDVNVTIDLSGTNAVEGDTLTVNGTDIVLTQAQIDAGSVETTVAAPAEGATLTVTATITDAAGNTSAPGTDSAILDTTAAVAPGVTITEDADNDGYISADELSGDVNVTIDLSGTNAVEGDTLTVNGTDIVLTQAQIDAGSVETTVAAPAEGATLTVTATITDAAGNTSAPGTDSAILDTTAAVAPGVTITEDADNDGYISADELSGDVNVTIDLSGTNAVEGDTLTVNGTDIVLTQAQIDAGSVETTVAAPAEGATLTVTATITDAAGNTSAPGTDSAILDTTAAVAPIITNITDDSAASDYSTVTLHGTGQAGSTITLYVIAGSTTAGNTTQTGSYVQTAITTVVNSDGTWTLDVSNIDDVAVNDNEFFKVTQTDPAGNESADSNIVHYYHGDWNPVVDETTDDFLFTGAADDTINITTNDANDNLVIDGGAGTDTVVISSSADRLTVTQDSEGYVIINDSSTGERIELRDVEYVTIDGSTYSTSQVLGVIAVNDGSITTNEDQTISNIDVLSNDLDFQGQGISVESATANHGTVTVNLDGTLNYTPNANSNGADTITYTIKDSAGNSSSATVAVNVVAVNDAPVANNDTVRTDEDTAVVINVLANDTDIDSNTLSVVNDATLSAAHGTVTVNADGNLVYTPNADYSGSDVISYTVSDGNGGTSNATVSVTVSPIADAPTIDVSSVDPTVTTQGLTGKAWYIESTKGDGLGLSEAALVSLYEEYSIQPVAYESTVTTASYTDIPAGYLTEIAGLIYLEAGHTYTFGGYGDDSVIMSLGGDTATYNNWGYDRGTDLDNVMTVTITESGYYKLSVIQHNQDGYGEIKVSVTVDGGSSDLLSTSNFVLLPDVDALIAQGERVSAEPTVTSEGSYYTVYSNNEGDEDTAIPLDSLTIALTDSSETLTVTVSGIPEGSVISDGTNSVTIGASGNGDITGFNYSQMTVTPPANYSGAFDAIFKATASEVVNDIVVDSASTSTTLSVEVYESIPTAYDSVPDVATLDSVSAIFAVNETEFVREDISPTTVNSSNVIKWGYNDGNDIDYSSLTLNSSGCSSNVDLSNGANITLASITHHNGATYTDESALDYVTVQVSLVIDGVTTTADIVLKQYDTNNSDQRTEDSITLMTESVEVEINGQSYLVVIDGLKSSDGTISNQVWTTENSDATYEIVAHVDAIQTLVGDISYDPGADGLAYLDWYVGTDVNSTATKQTNDVVILVGSYGTLTVYPDGSYSYEMSDSAKSTLTDGQEVSDIFTYQVVDTDGDIDTATVTIDLTGSDSFISASTTSLNGEFYIANKNEVNNISSAIHHIDTNQAEATFDSTRIDYDSGTYNTGLGDNLADNHLEAFLNAGGNSDGSSVVGFTDSAITDETVGIIDLNGGVNLSAGAYTLKVNNDDGYQIVIDGVVVASKDGGVSYDESYDYFNFVVDSSGVHQIEIVYYDLSGRYELDVQVKADSDTGYTTLGDGEYWFTNSSWTTVSSEAHTTILNFMEDGASNPEYFDNVYHAEKHGDSGNDVLDGNGGNDWIYGEGGNDILVGGDGSDHLFGGYNDDLLIGDGYNFNGTEYIAEGTSGTSISPDYLYGDSGDDILIGGVGADILEGGSGNDVLFGGSYDIVNDKLVSDNYADSLTGGEGKDLFILDGGTGDSADIITDFDSDSDAIDISLLLDDVVGSMEYADVQSYLDSHVTISSDVTHLQVDGVSVADFGSDTCLTAGADVSIIINDLEYTIKA